MPNYNYVRMQEEILEERESEDKTQIKAFVGEITGFIKTDPAMKFCNAVITELYCTGVINERVYVTLLNSDVVDETCRGFCDALELLIAKTMNSELKDRQANSFDPLH